MTMNSPLSTALASSDSSQFIPDPAIPVEVPTHNPLPPDSGILDDAATKAFNASDEGKKLKAWVDSEYKKAIDQRREYERQWYMNLAFYSGKQYVEWSKQDNKLVSQRVQNVHTPRLTINKIQPIVRTEQAKMTGQKPSASVMPSSNDDEDIFAATAGEQVWESLYARLNFPAKFSQSTFWLSICGTSFMKTFWDDSLWDPASKLYGDINWLPLSPLNVLVPDLLEPDLELQPWVMDVQIRPVEWANAAFADTFPKGVKATVTSMSEVLSAAGLQTNDKAKPDSAVIKEVWIKPNMTTCLPEGGMVTIIDDTIVSAAIKGIPYDHKEYPFAKFQHIPTGKFYGVSTIEALIPLQREYNRTQSQIVEAKNRMSKPQMFFRDGSLDPTKITSEPGQYIPIKGTAEFPKAAQLSELPQYVVNFNDRMEGDFENISGQHASTRGDAPSGMAATAIAYLQEQDDSYLTTTMQSIEQGIEKVARHSLVLAATYWTVPRLVKAVGEDGGYDAMMLKGAQISSSTDIRIERGSALSTSKSARQAQVTEWMKMGWIDPNEGFELLDMPMLQQWVSRRKVDKKAAQMENIKFRQLTAESITQSQQQFMATAGDPNNAMATHPDTGAPLAPPLMVPVNAWDDHEIHIQYHNLWRKSASFITVDPAVKAEVEKHVQMHEQALAATMAPVDPNAPAAPGATPDSISSAVGPAPDTSSAVVGSTQEQLAPPQ
jgi:hypothetical protein